MATREWGDPPGGAVVPFPEYLPYATAWRDALTGGVLTTSSPPASPDLFFVLDDGAGGDILLPTMSKWEVSASFFIRTSHANAVFWALPEFSVFGGAWTPLSSPVIKPVGLSDGASNETGAGEFQQDAPFDLGVKFRWSFALFAGPGGSEITVESGYAKALRTGSL